MDANIAAAVAAGLIVAALITILAGRGSIVGAVLAGAFAGVSTAIVAYSLVAGANDLIGFVSSHLLISFVAVICLLVSSMLLAGRVRPS